jgi:MFS family permease
MKTQQDGTRNWVLAAVFATCLGVGLVFGFEPPLIAMVLNRSGSSSLLIGAVIAISLIAVTIVGPWYPYAIARLGLRRSIVLGVAVGVLILLLMPVWRSVPAWFLLRVLTGCAIGLSWVASEIWMNTVSGDRSRGAVMGVYGVVFSTGTAAGPVLLEFTGTRGALPFVIGAACLALTLVPLVALPKAVTRSGAARGLAQARSAAESVHALRGCLRAAPVVMLAAATAGLVESADLSLLPLYGLHEGLDERGALLLLTVFLTGNVALQLPIGLLADRFGRRRLLAVCAAASAIGPLLLPHVLAIPALLWPLLLVWGGTLYAFYAQGIALLGEEFPAEALADANTLFVMIYCVGGVVGPGIGGLALDTWPHWGFCVLVASAAAMLLAGLAVASVRQLEP